MDNRLSRLQSLQDLFAESSGLSVLLTNDRGEWITRPSGMIESSNGEAESMMRSLASRLHSLLSTVDTIRSGIVYDVSPGVRLLLAPVYAHKNQVFYVWAGCLVDDRQTSQPVGPTGNGQSSFPWTDVLAAVKQVHSDDTMRALNQVNRIASIAEQLLKAEYAEEAGIRRMDLLRELALRDGDWDEWTSALLDADDDIDFVGFAARSADQRLTIASYAGPAGDSVRGLSFSLGEGYVGQVATTRKAAFWDHVAQDPRAFAFTQRGLSPASLFCVPIMRERELAGVLFGGSVMERTVGRSLQSFVQSIGAAMSVRSSLAAVRVDRNTNFTRLSTFVETCGAIYHAQDVKRLSFILVDMSLNLVEGPFSCVVLRQSDQKVQLVSRGIGRQQAELYVKEMVARWAKREGGSSASEGILYKEPGRTPVLEIPLVYRNEQLGLWCIALKDAEQFALYREYMGIVAQACCAAIYRLWDKGKIEWGDAVQLLNQALGYWDPHAYELTHEAQELALAFGRSRKMSEAELKQLAEACLVFPYSPAFLGDALRSPEQLELIGHFHAIVRLNEGGRPEEARTAPAHASEPSTVFPAEGQIMALVYYYLKFDRDVRTLESLWAVSPELRSAFRLFLESQEVVESEITLGAAEASSAKQPDSDVPDIPSLQHLPALSAREREVLGHVLRGQSNREIAERLIISEHTVKNHMTNIFQKLGVTDRAQAIAMVYKAGWNR